jgi:hypothetical protein
LSETTGSGPASAATTSGFTASERAILDWNELSGSCESQLVTNVSKADTQMKKTGCPDFLKGFFIRRIKTGFQINVAER